MAVDSSGDLYIADGSASVRKVDNHGVIFTLAGDHTSGFSGDGGSASSAQVGILEGITIDAASYPYIADLDHRCIRKVDDNGAISTFAGNGETASEAMAALQRRPSYTFPSLSPSTRSVRCSSLTPETTVFARWPART